MRPAAIREMLSIIPSVLRGVTLEDLERIKRIIHASFPSVRQASGQTLVDWFNESSSSLLLIDVRSPKEYAVSHLRSALNLHNAVDIQRLMIERRPSRTILYCSVGFRSSMIAARLKNVSGQVFNLEGSIFEWANQGRPVYRGEIPASTVHPFGKRWAGLLKKGLASKLP